MARMLKVRPTKIELVKLERRLGLSRRVKKILKDRLAILTKAFIDTARQAIKARREMAETVQRAVRAAAVAEGYHGALALDGALAASEGEVRVQVGTRNVAGARIPALALSLPDAEMPPYDLARTSSMVDEAAEAGRAALPAIVRLAELERSLEVLGAEIQRTKRIANALEHRVVPSLERTINALRMKFEERDREEKSRLKHIKTMRSPGVGPSQQHENNEVTAENRP
ncbi:MAG: V-type ATP synthase subunit D [Gammaproteobacteria bacterium]